MTTKPTLLHISDTQFGAHHQFGLGIDSLASRLLNDLLSLRELVPAPDVVVVSGDLTEWARPEEFAAVAAFLDQLLDSLHLESERLVVVPGNHDINRDLCESYFLQCRGNGQEVLPPYYPKWAPYANFTAASLGSTRFTPDRPYSLHVLEDQRLVFAEINSTFGESHLEVDHYGRCGEDQLQWMRERLEKYANFVRVAVVHHNVRAQSDTIDEERLRDDGDFARLIAPHCDFILHGHTHNGKTDRMPDGTLILATGSAAVKSNWRPTETGNQYQILQLTDRYIKRWTRRYHPNRREWIADTSLSANGADWVEEIPIELPGLGEASLPPVGAALQATSDFLADVRLVTRITHPDCLTERRVISDSGQETEYLVVAYRGELQVVGAVDRDIAAHDLEFFDRVVHQPFRQRSPFAQSTLVHTGLPNPRLRAAIAQSGIVLQTWAEYQQLLDLSLYKVDLQEGLKQDALYPQGLYIEQSYRVLDRFARPEAHRQTGLAAQLIELLHDNDQRFILVLGDAGFGKSFLLRRVANLLLEEETGLVPILVRLRNLERSHSLAEMVSQTITSSGATFQLDRFEHMFNSGRIVLLADGYDEFAARVGYERAADQLGKFVKATQGRAKIILTTRPSHFRSRNQATAKIFDDVVTHTRHRLFELEPFTEVEQREFLIRWFKKDGGENTQLADRWMRALATVDNLPELARTPRMLAFMVRDLTLEETEAAGLHGAKITAAALYDRLVTQWLSTESTSVTSKTTLSVDDRRLIAEELAYASWSTSAISIDEALLESTAAQVLDLPSLRLTKVEAAHDIGARGLLVGDETNRRFVHQSVFEFLLASRLAKNLANAETQSLGVAELSDLTARFLVDLNAGGATDWLRKLAEQ
jgi:3',5'-cyclic AMP phosphodiesterase CpdA